jgi:hypothetical protein
MNNPLPELIPEYTTQGKPIPDDIAKTSPLRSITQLLAVVTGAVNNDVRHMNAGRDANSDTNAKPINKQCKSQVLAIVCENQVINKQIPISQATDKVRMANDFRVE